MKSIVIFLIVFALTFQIITSREISFNEANTIAENWAIDLEKHFNDQVRIATGREVYREGILVAYVFDLYPKGYVIISPQDYLPPIKMYSLTSRFNSSGSPIEDLIFNKNQKLINDIKKNLINEDKISPTNKNSFRYFLSEDINKENSMSRRINIVEEVGPLLSTKWGQAGVYGEYCPNGLSGCNATSFAQIFNYHEWPIVGSGSETYFDPFSGETLTANFDKEYEWWNMLDEYGEGSSEENNSVSTLMYDIGVAIHTAYDWDASSANPKNYLYNFIQHFLYSSEIQWIRWMDFKNDDKWFSILKNQIDNAWPFELGITGKFGHSVAVDGYRNTVNLKMFHVNFGWNGSYNGYYSFDNIYLSEAISFLEHNLHTAIINIFPYPEYQKPIGLAPETITVDSSLNRSVFLSEYIHKISWTESPSQDKRIKKYIIYQKKDHTIEEIDRIDPENKTYEIRTKEISGYQFSVGVIDKNGVISGIPPFVTPTLN